MSAWSFYFLVAWDLLFVSAFLSPGFVGFDLFFEHPCTWTSARTHHREGLGILLGGGVDLAHEPVGLGQVVGGQGQAEQHDPRGVGLFLGWPIP